MADSFDVIVIGGGPGRLRRRDPRRPAGQEDRGGRARQAGRSLPQLRLHPGQDRAAHGRDLRRRPHDGAELGVVAKDVSLDWEALGKRRAAVSESLSNGVKMLWDKNKIDADRGRGLADARRQTSRSATTSTRRARSILATGSVALPIPGVEFGGRVVDTWGAWSLPEQPKRIAVVGAGASGAEIASAYGRFGTEVLLIEMLDQILPAEDKDMARVVERAFKKQNITISTGTPVENVEAGENSVKFSYGGESAEVDYLCIAGGRGADVEGLGLDDAGVELERERQGQGRRVPADDLEPEGLRDRRPGPRQGARPQGLRGGRRRGRARRRRSRPTRSTRTSSPGPPSATRRSPASASPRRRRRRPGTTSRSASRSSAASAGPPSTTTKTAWSSSSSTRKYGEILGAHIVGNRACDMIAELVATMALEGGYQELAEIVHPHPTISEAILEAARAVDGWAIHA